MSTPDPIETYVKEVVDRKRKAMGFTTSAKTDTIHESVQRRTLQQFKQKLATEKVKRTRIGTATDIEWIYTYYEQAYRLEESLCDMDDKKVEAAFMKGTPTTLPAGKPLASWRGDLLMDTKEPLSEDQATTKIHTILSKLPKDSKGVIESRFPFEKMPERTPDDIAPSRAVDPLRTLIPLKSNKFQTKDEEIYTKIEYNERKIAFLRAQWELLDTYLSKALETIPEEDRAEVKRRAGISNYSPIIHSTPPDAPPTASLLAQLDEVILNSNICLAALRENGVPV
jgi:hypothetical protein